MHSQFFWSHVYSIVTLGNCRWGVVLAAVYDEKIDVMIIYPEALDGIRPMMGSKYL